MGRYLVKYPLFWLNLIFVLRIFIGPQHYSTTPQHQSTTPSTTAPKHHTQHHSTTASTTVPKHHSQHQSTTAQHYNTTAPKHHSQHYSTKASHHSTALKHHSTKAPQPALQHQSTTPQHHSTALQHHSTKAPHPAPQHHSPSSKCVIFINPNNKQDRQCMCNVTIKSVYVTTDVEKQKSHVFWVCICSLSYPASKWHGPHYIATCGLSGCAIFFHVIS